MKYTHIDKAGMPWRFVGSRPVSALADTIMNLPLRKERREVFQKSFYILKGHRAVRVAFSKWLERPQLGTPVAQTQIKEGRRSVLVSTIFLGINHAHGSGPPILFETMVFGGKRNGEALRYSTWRQALAGHKALVALLSSHKAIVTLLSP